MKEIRVNVYPSLPRRRGEVIARVRYTNNLDTWHKDGWYTERPALHKGLTKLRDGRYVAIYDGENGCYGLIVTAQEALEEVLKSGHMELLKTKKFRLLGEMYKEREK